MRNSAGFTMIELMITIAIAGILVAVAVPSFTESMARRRMEGVANELSADLQYAKSQAASINANVTLLTTAHGYSVSSTSATHKTIVLDSSISLTDSVTVTFEPYRTLPTSAASITVTHSQTSVSLQVKTDIMGRIQLCSPGSSYGGYAACI